MAQMTPANEHARDGLRGGRAAAARGRAAVPEPAPGQLLLRVHACGVCRTDLHLLDGEVEIPEPPRVLGHQIVGTVVAAEGAERRRGRRRAAASAATASACRGSAGPAANAPTAPADARTSARDARFTGRDIDGGYAEYAVADARYCFPIPPSYTDEQAAPLLCAGLIGYRALRMCGEAHRVGFYGFGASAHILAQVCVWQGREVYAFTRPGGDEAAQASRASSARSGRAPPRSRRHSRSTPRSSSLPSARSCRSRCAPSRRAASSSAAAST